MRPFILRIMNSLRGSRNTFPYEYVDDDISNRRVEALIDGAFAIVLTLLALEIKSPHADSDLKLTEALIALSPKIFAYFLSFIILGLLWFGHQMMAHYVKRSDRNHILLNLLFLMFVALIPFSTALLGENLQYHSATIVYGVNLFITGLIQYLHWEYMSSQNRLIDSELDRRIVRSVQKTFLAIPLVCGLGIGVSFVSIPAGLLLYGLSTAFGASRMTAIFHRSHYPHA
ncbi:TMEM175 family protein [Tumidithrix helvetica PCC 7403]|uniref:TMEM175 family protein n=1 Tax=Tumidithrix helvetica TaxID=3457545 RepID=UPI003CB453BE